VCCAAAMYPAAVRGDYAGRAPVAAAHEKQHIRVDMYSNNMPIMYEHITYINVEVYILYTEGDFLTMLAPIFPFNRLGNLRLFEL